MSSAEYSGDRQFAWILAASVVALVLALLVFHWYMERNELLESAHSQASVVASNAGAALVFNDAAAAEETLAALARWPSVIEAALYRDSGDLLAGFQNGRGSAANPLEPSAPTVGHAFLLRELRVAIPVLLDARRVGTLALRVSQDRLYGELLNFVAGYLLIAGFVTVLAYLATRGLRRRLRKYRDDLEASHARLRQMIAHREDILEAEHKRIAMEIHDELGQILTAALMNLRMIKRGHGNPGTDVAQLIEDAQSQLDAAYCGMKNIAASLHPAVLQFGFIPAIEWLAERILKLTGIRWSIEAATSLPPLDPRQSMALFRIVQESLTNIVRHAEAATVRIVAQAAHGGLVLEVTDDGRGLDAARDVTAEMKFGLVGMRERAESIGAHVTISGMPGRGTCVSVVLPLVEHEQPLVGREISDQ